MAKPFSIQSPEDIAKEYAGNKQKIAQAMQMGVVDATAGVLAGMFIDRMRAAQMQEQAPQATVAQKVMGGLPPAPPTPPSPAGGIGALPQGAPPMAPEMAAPAPEMPAPEGAPTGMAEGGLATLPIADNMFDEPTNGGYDDGYAGGGIVAFAEGGTPLEAQFDAALPPRAAGKTYYGYSATDPLANAATFERLYGKPQTKYAEEYEQELLRERSPESRKKARDRDINYALMALGSRMASTPGSIFQSLGAGIGEAAPILRESAKERRAEEREIRKGLLDLEAGRNTAAAQKAASLLQMQQMGITGQEAEAGRTANMDLERLRQVGAEKLERIRQSGDERVARIRASSSGGYGDDSDGEGRGTTVTANRYTEMREKYLTYKREHDAAKRAWVRAGKPTVNDKNTRKAEIARAFIDAHSVYLDYENTLNGVRVRGSNRQSSDSGRAVQDGQIIDYDAKGNRI